MQQFPSYLPTPWTPVAYRTKSVHFSESLRKLPGLWSIWHFGWSSSVFWKQIFYRPQLSLQGSSAVWVDPFQKKVSCSSRSATNQLFYRQEWRYQGPNLVSVLQTAADCTCSRTAGHGGTQIKSTWWEHTNDSLYGWILVPAASGYFCTSTPNHFPLDMTKQPSETLSQSLLPLWGNWCWDFNTLLNVLHEATVAKLTWTLMFSALRHFNSSAFIPVNMGCQDKYLLFTHSNHLSNDVLHITFPLSSSQIKHMTYAHAAR